MIKVEDIQSPNYFKNLDRPAPVGTYPCIVCGRPVKEPWPHAIRLHGGGSLIVTKAEAIQLNAQGHSGGDMYGYPVGPDCARKIKILKPYIDDAAATVDEES